MKQAKAISLLPFYVVSIFGYGTIEFSHFLAHKFKNPFHHHAVHKHSHHSHSVQDHGVSKLFKANTETQQAIKFVKELYFFSFQECLLSLINKSIISTSQKFAAFSLQLAEMNFPPPAPPPDLG